MIDCTICELRALFECAAAGDYETELTEDDLLPLTDEEVSGLLRVLDPFQAPCTAR